MALRHYTTTPMSSAPHIVTQRDYSATGILFRSHFLHNPEHKRFLQSNYQCEIAASRVRHLSSIPTEPWAYVTFALFAIFHTPNFILEANQTVARSSAWYGLQIVVCLLSSKSPDEVSDAVWWDCRSLHRSTVSFETEHYSGRQTASRCPISGRPRPSYSRKQSISLTYIQ